MDTARVISRLEGKRVEEEDREPMIEIQGVGIISLPSALR